VPPCGVLKDFSRPRSSIPGVPFTFVMRCMMDARPGGR
jgi:hypothetical protein